MLREQKAARLARQQLTKDIKNERRKRSRLTKKARLLTTEDLLQVIAMRERDGMHAVSAESRPALQDGDGLQPDDMDRVEEPGAPSSTAREPSPDLQDAERMVH